MGSGNGGWEAGALYRGEGPFFAELARKGCPQPDPQNMGQTFLGGEGMEGSSTHSLVAFRRLSPEMALPQ